MQKKIIIAGIGTDVGKTVVAAIVMRLLKADYWKPVSCGLSDKRDSKEIHRLQKDSSLVIHQESYHFEAPQSPHHAAFLEGIEPDILKVTLPKTNNHLVIESAGGLLVPFNNRLLMLDVLSKWDCFWILVSKNYLGSINHTLLSIESLKKRDLNVLGIVFNGPENQQSETFITKYAELPVIGSIQEEQNIDTKVIGRYCNLWKQHPFWKKMMC